jgi:hypothetical protein
MFKDFGKTTIHVNRQYSNSWSLGIDYYHMYDYPEGILSAKVCIIGFVFFNVTITRWTSWISKNS